MRVLPNHSALPAEKAERYAIVIAELRELIQDERDYLANTANGAAPLFHLLPDLNWAGFYFSKGNDLVLGPFQGAPACVRISLGRGVCGAAATSRKTIVVPDVAKFPGHIACDPDSKSEIVVPLCHNDQLLGVLDLDSASIGRFDDVDSHWLQTFAATLLLGTDFPMTL